jgi:hypothetical protein
LISSHHLFGTRSITLKKKINVGDNGSDANEIQKSATNPAQNLQPTPERIFLNDPEYPRVDQQGPIDNRAV